MWKYPIDENLFEQFSKYSKIESFSLAMNMRPAKGWTWWLINALFSILIGILFIVGWPFTSTYLIGLLVGFSLFFDGFALLITGSIFKKMNQ